MVRDETPMSGQVRMLRGFTEPKAYDRNLSSAEKAAAFIAQLEMPLVNFD
jgi:hypothetical protein